MTYPHEASAATARVAVVGSANLDIVMSVTRFPRGGETILGDHLEEVAGGKGLNQAIAAAGASTCAFIGCIGDDDAGGRLVSELDGAGVDTSRLVRRSDATGRAFIQVTPDGENSIVVLPLANQRLEIADVRTALEALAPTVVLAQLEIPLETVEAAAAWARSSGARFLLNPSPVRPLPEPLLELCDPLIVNAGEAAALLHETSTLESRADDEVHDLAKRLTDLARSVAVTDGPRGVHVGGTSAGLAKLPGHRVTAVDSTGAGDAFAGTLAAALAEGLDLTAAAEKANAAAARIVQIPRSRR